MMSNLTGIVKLYQLTGNEKLLKAAKMHGKILRLTSFILQEQQARGSYSRKILYCCRKWCKHGEGCVTVTWLQFARHYIVSPANQNISMKLKNNIQPFVCSRKSGNGLRELLYRVTGKKPYRCTINGIAALQVYHEELLQFLNWLTQKIRIMALTSTFIRKENSRIRFLQRMERSWDWMYYGY